MLRGGPKSEKSYWLLNETVVAALQQMGVDLEQGALLTVNPKRIRVRILPLRRSGE